MTADVLAFGRTLHQEIRRRVVDLGVASEDFVLNATHTHNGPVLVETLDPYIAYGMTDTTEITRYSWSLTMKIVDLVRRALAAEGDTCTLDYRVCDEDFCVNREGLPYVERAVPTLVARTLDGTPRAVLFSYAAHPVAGGWSTWFDPDYPSEAIKTIEASYPGAFAQFVLGPAGDQNPASVYGGFVGADDYGRDLGLTIANEIETPGRTVTGPIATAYTEVSLALDIAAVGNLSTAGDAFRARAANDTLPGFYRRHGEVMADRAENGSFASAVQLPIQRWTFSGDDALTMVFCGGEIVSGYAVFFRALLGGPESLWFSGYANEVPAYIPSEEILARASYAAGYDDDYPGIGGGSMTVYGQLAHFVRTGVDGVEARTLDAIGSLL